MAHACKSENSTEMAFASAVRRDLCSQTKGFFKAEGINAEIVSGGPGIIVEQQVLSGAADIGISSADSLLVHRDLGLPLVSIAQILQKSSMMLVDKKAAGIDHPAKMRGKRIGTFSGSSQYQLLAFLRKNGLNPHEDVRLVLQNSIQAFFDNQVKAASATVYNEFQTILEKGIKRADLNIFRFAREGVGMLEDTVIAREDWIKEHRALAVKVVRAVLRGWRYAVLRQREAVDIVMKYVAKGTTTREHQVRMLQSVSRFIVPEEFGIAGIGTFCERSLKQTAGILLRYGLIKKPGQSASGV
jgi:NitT/TauT family transport system substrate-binding protein